MKPLSALPAARARALAGVVFDLDGTVLTGGRLGLRAYEALHRLAGAGLSLVVCTGRSAAWGEVVARQWPVAMAVTENGAVTFARQGGRLRQVSRLTDTERTAARARLAEVAASLRQGFPELSESDDNRGRLADYTFDIGEHHTLPVAIVNRVRDAAHALGVRTFASSIHLHITLDGDDKATGTLHALRVLCGQDPTAARARYAFVGDSGNDAACFAAFATTFGVRNVLASLPQLSVAPGYLSDGEEGEGFAEIAEVICALRAGSGDLPASAHSP